MLNQLKKNIKTIYDELNKNLIPANIRKGVTILNVEGTLEQSGIAYSPKEQVNNIVVSKPDTGSYMFALNSDGYYESNNKGVNNSYALCKVTFNALYDGCSLILDCINYAESSFDFGILSKLDTELNANSSVDSTDLIEKSFKGSSMSSVQRYQYINISKGEHFIYIKFRKDGSNSNYNDSFQFKVVSFIDEYQNVKIYNNLTTMNNDIEQLDGTYATINIGNQVFENFYRYNASSKVWVKTQSTIFTAGQYETTAEFQQDILHFGPNYIGVINEPNGKIPLNIYKTGSTKIDNFDDVVTLQEAVLENETYHIDNLIGTEEDYFRGSVSIDLTHNKFKVEQYNELSYSDPNIQNYILEYESTDGITYTQSKNTFERELYIYNDETSNLKGNYDNRIGSFLYTTGNVLTGLYYKSTATSSPTRLENQLYCTKQELPNEYTVYANAGVIKGELYNKPISGSDITYKFNVYERLKELLENPDLYNDLNISLSNYKNTVLPITQFNDVRGFSSYSGNLETAILNFGNIENNLYIEQNNNLKTVDITFSSVNTIRIYNCTKLESIKLTGNINSNSIQFNENPNLKEINLSGLVFTNNLTSLSSLFTNCKSLTDSALPELDTSLVTSFSSAFSGCELLTVAPAYDYSNNKSLSNTFSRCTALTDISNASIQGDLTTISSMCSNCSNLITVPQFDLSHFTSYSWSSAFANCPNLSDISLNNILATLSTAPSTITNNKTLKYCGLSVEQCKLCQTLDNYQTFLDSGWTLGYTDEELTE